MTLIYSPSNIYMTPNGNAVDMKSGILPMSFIFNGYKLKNVEYDLYSNMGSGKWNLLYGGVDALLTKTYYNRDIIEFSSIEDLSSYYNGKCGWKAKVFGETFNIVSDSITPTNNSYPLNVEGLESGDEVYLKNQYDKIQVDENLMPQLSFTTNGISYNNGAFLNGDKEIVVSDQWYKYTSLGVSKKENTGDIVFDANRWYKISVSYNLYSGINAENLPVIISLDVDNIFQVAPSQQIKKITRNENKSETIEITFKYNQNITTTQETFFNFYLKGTSGVGLNNAVIPSNDAFIAFSLLGSVSTNVAYVNVEGNRTIFHANREGSLQGSLGDTILYDWIGTGNTVTPYSESPIVPFIPFIPFSVSLDVPEILDTLKYEFVPMWSGDNVPVINQYQAFLFYEDGRLIEESNQIYDANVRYSFENQFLNNNKYYVKFFIYDNNGYLYEVQSNVFLVQYSIVSIEYNPLAVNNCKDSTVNVKWDGIKIVDSNVAGDHEYINNYGSQNNYGIKLQNNSKLTYNLDIPTITFPSFYWSPNSNDFDGEILTMSNDEGGTLIISYEKDVRKFTLTTQEGENYYSGIIYEIDRDITINDIFLFGFYGEEDFSYARLVSEETINRRAGD